MSGRGFKVLLSEFLVFESRGDVTLKEHNGGKNIAKFFRQIRTFLIIFTFFAGFECVKAMDSEFKDQNATQAKLAATKYKKKTTDLQAQLEEFKLQQASGITINVGEITKSLKARIKEGLEGNAFGSPVKKANQGLKTPPTPGNANLLHEIQEIVIDIDSAGKTPVALIQSVQTEFLNELFKVFKQYVERKQQRPTASSDLSIVVRNGGSPVKAIRVDAESLLHAFRLAAVRVLDPNIANLLRDCQLQVVLPAAVLEVTSPVLNLKAEGERYVNKIKEAIDEEGTLYDIVQQYRYESDEDEKHAMLMFMLRHNTKELAENFRASKEATTMIEVGEELRDGFYDTAFLTFIRYISGNTNKTNVSEIITLTNGGRGQTISENIIISLQQELEQIFYPKRGSSSLTVTRYEFGRPTGREISAVRRRPLLTIGGWNLPVVNTVVNAAGTLAETLFGSCMVPPQNLLTNGEGSTGSNSRAAIQDSKVEDI